MTKIKQNIYDKILASEHKQISVLIDPDKHSQQSLTQLLSEANDAEVDFLMIGSSLLLGGIDDCIDLIRNYSDIPLILFPGQLLQLSFSVDAILFLSLVSGRNPDLLIGRHIEAAPLIKKFGIESIPTGYIIVESGRVTSVEYMSNTRPLPSDKPDIAMATAQAAELLGMKLIYMDAGSGALNPISCKMISSVKSSINIPLIIGGGLRSEAQVLSACTAGADIVVIGNIFEKSSKLLANFTSIVHGF